MRMNARSLLFVAIVMSLMLSACAAPAAAPAADSSGGDGDSITIDHWFGVTSAGSEQADCMVATVVDPYSEQTDGVTIEATMQPNNWETTRTSVAGGGGPDLVTTPGPSFVFEMAQAGQLLPLSDYAEQLGWGDTFAPWALSLGMVDGELYSVPVELETLVLYYNKTLFEENGWTPPTTVEELLALAEEMVAADVIPFAHANAEWRPSNEWFVGEFMNHIAGPDAVYQALIGEKPWTDPEFVEAISVLDSMQQNGWFMGGLDRYYTATDDERIATFADGGAAMSIEGTWALNNMSNYFEEGSGNEWDWVPMPSASGEAIFDLGIGSTYSINSATEHPDEVAAYLSYYTSPESQAKLLTECNLAPGPVALTADMLEGIDPRQAALFEGLSNSSAEGNYGYTTWTFWPPKSDIYIYEEVEKVWAGQITAEQYLQGLQEMFQEELEAGDIPPIPER